MSLEEITQVLNVEIRINYKQEKTSKIRKKLYIELQYSRG